MLKIRKRTLIVAIVASLLLPTLVVNPARASTGIYKDYKPSYNLVIDWGFSVGPIPVLATHSEVSNLVVRAYSDREIDIWGDISADLGAILTVVSVEVLTALSATVEIPSFTWSNPVKWADPRTQFTLDNLLPATISFPGARFFCAGPGNGHFELKITNINPAAGVFAVLVTVGNLGSGLALVLDIYDIIGISTKLPEKVILGLQTLIGAGANTASLILSPPIYLAADLFPTTSGTVPSGPPPPGGFEVVMPLAVYYDEHYPTSWVSRNEAITFRNYLAEKGFVVLDAANLKTFMQNAGKYSVVVMAQDVVPDTVGDVKSSSAIIRQYLDRGGRVVWVEDVPMYYQGHADGTMTTWGTAGEHDILGIWEGTWGLGATVQIKPEGVNRGLTQTWVSARESDDGSISAVLADEDNTDAAGYVKNFNNGGNFIRIWDNGGDFTSNTYLLDLATVATTGSLSWQVDLTAYNADPTYARCADMYINGYYKRIITWLDPLQTVTGTIRLPGYWFNIERNTIDAWVTTYDQYDYGRSWTTVMLTSPEGFTAAYYRMRPANRDRMAYFEYFMTGLWHVTNYRYYSAPVSIAYNLPFTHNYDTGKRTSGVFLFTDDLKDYSSASLSFYHEFWIESASYGAYDILSVQISADAGKTWTTLRQWDSRNPSQTTWAQVTADITPYVGASVQIRFSFDSVDSIANNYEGWYIDDIVVSGTRQNDAGTGNDAGNSFSAATPINPGTYTGTLVSLDREDWYQFYAASGQNIYVSMTPPSGVDFDLQLYDPAGNYKTGSYLGAGATDSVSWTAGSSGYWRSRIYVFSGSGQYSTYVSVTTPGGGGGGGGCPTLFVWDGEQYVMDGTIDDHASDDVTLQWKIQNTPVPEGDFYKLSLREIDQFTTHIDYVKLYSVDANGNLQEIPLVKATHSELGDVKRQLLLNDAIRVDTTPGQTIELKFPVLDIPTAYFILEIDSYNMKPTPI